MRETIETPAGIETPCKPFEPRVLSQKCSIYRHLQITAVIESLSLRHFNKLLRLHTLETGIKATVLKPFVRLLSNEHVNEQVSSYQEHTPQSGSEDRIGQKMVHSTQF
jgi:hypothetical protein